MHGGAGCLNIGIESVQARSQLFVLLARDDTVLYQIAVTIDLSQAPLRLRSLFCQVCFGLFLQSQVAGKVRLRLLETCFEGSRINRKEKVAFSYIGAVREMNCNDASGNLGLNGYSFPGHGFANRIQISGHILGDGLSYQYRRRRCVKPLLSLINTGG